MPRKIDGSTWDLSGDKKSSNCGAVAMVGKMAAGVAGGLIATFLCSRSTSGQRDFSAPDLSVQLVAGDARYRTPIALDTYAEAFDFSMIVPLEGIPPAGLEVQVLDQDDDVGTGELIGMVRVTRMQVQGTFVATMPLLTLSDSQLERIEIEVTPYSAPSPLAPSTFEVNHEPAGAAIRARAGELVTIAARGQYSVANNRNEIIDERGYLDGRKRDYNHAEFKNANHGAAVALIGASHESHMAVLVGSCTAAVASVAGQIFIRVNDNSVGNNHGFITFAARVGLPTLEQWRAGGAFECARQPSRDNQASIAAASTATDLPDSINAAMIAEGLATVRDEIRGCRVPSTARGMVKLAVTVGPGGSVTSVSIKAAPDRALAMCAAAAARNAMFPRTRNGGAFIYPFMF